MHVVCGLQEETTHMKARQHQMSSVRLAVPTPPVVMLASSSGCGAYPPKDGSLTYQANMIIMPKWSLNWRIIVQLIPTHGVVWPFRARKQLRGVEAICPELLVIDYSPNPSGLRTHQNQNHIRHANFYLCRSDILKFHVQLAARPCRRNSEVWLHT